MTRTVADWLYRYRWFPWAVTLAILLTVVLPQHYDRMRFAMFPVLSMEGVLIGRVGDAAHIHIYGEKLRGIECRYIGISAFADRLVGLPVDLEIRRINIPQTGTTKPAGPWDIGVWEVRPVQGATRVRVYTSHDCQGSLVATKVAEVPL